MPKFVLRHPVIFEAHVVRFETVNGQQRKIVDSPVDPGGAKWLESYVSVRLASTGKRKNKAERLEAYATLRNGKTVTLSEGDWVVADPQGGRAKNGKLFSIVMDGSFHTVYREINPNQCSRPLPSTAITPVVEDLEAINLFLSLRRPKPNEPTVNIGPIMTLAISALSAKARRAYEEVVTSERRQD